MTSRTNITSRIKTCLWCRILALVATISLGPPPARAQDLADLEYVARQQAVREVEPSVVQVQPVGGREAVEGTLVSQAPSTGLIVAPGGFVLTSAHTLAQQPASILIRGSDGAPHAARIVARDRARMLVLLQAQGLPDLPIPQFVPREEIQVGQTVIALGKVFDPARANVSTGIVSANDRIWGRALQTDAKISPLNYGGPLIDLRGRVLGILTPMSPDSETEMAGVELYDSGIGFAVYLADLMQGQLARMIQGESIQPGLLGITLKGQNIYTSRAIIGWCPPKTPAREAGLRAGDEIVELDGLTITRQAQLRHALGRRIAGETVSLVVRRGEQSLSFQVPLIDRVDPYELPFLGLLLERAAEDAVKVRYVYARSPAAEAGIQVGDRLLQIEDRQPASRAEWYDAVTQFLPGDRVTLVVQRGSQKVSLSTTLGRQPDELPEDLIPRKAPQPDVAAPELPKPVEKPGGAGAPEFQRFRLPEEPNECLVWLPERPAAGVPGGVLMWILPPGELDTEQIWSVWGEACQRHGFTLMLPRPRDAATWQTAEVDVLRKMLERLLKNHPVDPRRVVVGGYRVGAALACGLAFQHRERARGVILLDARFPPGFTPRGNDPEERLEFLHVPAGDETLVRQQVASLERLKAIKFPVVSLAPVATPNPPDPQTAAQILAWADTLDRL